MSNQCFSGYSAYVWQAMYEALALYDDEVTAAIATNTPSTVVALSQTLLQSIGNAVDLVNANALVSAWQTEYAGLLTVAAIPLAGIDPTSATYFNNRLAAYASGISGLSALIPSSNTFPNTALLLQGTSAVPYIGLLEFFEVFAYEPVPAGLTASTFAADATQVATSFGVVATALKVFQGTFPTQVYDVLTREINAQNEAAYIVNQLTSGPVASNITTVNAWNQIVTLPAMLMAADILNDAPSLQQNQQSACIRNALITIGAQIAAFLYSVNAPTTTVVNQATLQQGETLMDMAARSLGNFELWTEIAALNNLTPPYVGSTASSGVAAYGSQLILPAPGTAKSSSSVVPSYSTNFLGTDIYVGPINGAMPSWTGDFQLISGYNNLAWALGRRLQTTQGGLIYHGAYGSRIPPEIGMLLNTQTAGHVTAYGTSALLSDPRVQSVISAVSSLIPSNQGVNFAAAVQPIGTGSQGIAVNQVITPGF